LFSGKAGRVTVILPIALSGAEQTFAGPENVPEPSSSFQSRTRTPALTHPGPGGSEEGGPVLLRAPLPSRRSGFFSSGERRGARGESGPACPPGRRPPASTPRVTVRWRWRSSASIARPPGGRNDREITAPGRQPDPAQSGPPVSPTNTSPQAGGHRGGYGRGGADLKAPQHPTPPGPATPDGPDHPRSACLCPSFARPETISAIAP